MLSSASVLSSSIAAPQGVGMKSAEVSDSAIFEHLGAGPKELGA